ncbi:unnamed protein product [Rotaria socialis]|uniref:Uncharacterized protein n=2 Tax=Rotaria socialis TaxID=392032 RepID=A0A821FWF1_9BILA|nr:unnamed protein product [Rotaria socialis]CAF4452901.1 unnamed protein product [Rotaria socialis]CAF4655228.1 unnamed protein product [Rotaria socialis]
MYVIKGPRVALCEWICSLFNRIRNALRNLNLFYRRNSDASAILEQILTTRLYIGCLFTSLLILILATGFSERTVINTVVLPSVAEFEKIAQTERQTLSCPCSEIAIQNSAFISVTYTLHQICSSELLSDDSLDRLSYIDHIRSAYYYLDIRLYGLDMFRAIISYCILSNSTINDALATLLNTYLITTETLSRQDFNEQTQVLISNFLSNVKQTFKYMSVLAHETTRGNQLLSSRVSNFFLDGIFDSNQNLIRVQTHLGTMSSIDDMLPTCSCALSMCSQLLGFFNRSSNGSIFTLITEIPGMYSACYPLDGLRKSTLECWFNDTCIEIISSNLTPFPVDISFNPLNASQLIRFSPKSTLGDIIDEIMVEEWRQTISYEAYYRSCKPLKCVFTYTHRLDLIYVVTTLAAVFGGLSVSFQIVCSWLIKFYVHRRRTNTVSTSTNSSIVGTSIRPSIVFNAKRYLRTINLFDSQSPHVHIAQRERLSTRVYVVLLVSATICLTIYLFFVENQHIATMKLTSSADVTQFYEKYTTDLSCPCKHASIQYSMFVSLKVLKYHPICSSQFLSLDYLKALMGDSLVVDPDSIRFKGQFLAGQLSLLSSFCTMANDTMNTSLALFVGKQFIAAQILTNDQFQAQINKTVSLLLLDISLSFRQAIDYLEAIIHGNAIMSSYMSNWQFIVNPPVKTRFIRTRPVWYGNCSCASSDKCSLPMSITNISFPGLLIGCLPLPVLLQSTLECFYNQTCLDTLHYALFDHTKMKSLPTSLMMSSHFLPNASIGSIFDELFVENWFRQYDYEAFFRACEVSMCTYIYSARPDILYVLTTIIGLIGGLTVFFRIICPLLVMGYNHLIDFFRNGRRTVPLYTLPVQPSTVVTSISTSANISCGELSLILPSFAIAALNSADKFRFTIVATATVTALQSTPPVPIIPLCSINATWKREAVTVAGFSNSTSDSSLSGLYYPEDIVVDAMGNLYIQDFLNRRILYWPTNSTEGRSIAGTGVSGEEPNQLRSPDGLLGDDQF